LRRAERNANGFGLIRRDRKNRRNDQPVRNWLKDIPALSLRPALYGDVEVYVQRVQAGK